jgi:hypothetical protein
MECSSRLVFPPRKLQLQLTVYRILGNTMGLSIRVRDSGSSDLVEQIPRALKYVIGT